MFFLNKKQFEEYTKKIVEKSSRAQIDDEPSYSKKYVEREIQVSYEDMWRMYLRNEWVRACVDKITKAVAKADLVATPNRPEDTKNEQTKYHIEEIQKLMDDPNSGVGSFEDIKREVLRDILVYDSGAMEIVYDDKDVPAEIYSLPGDRIRLNVDSHGNFKDDETAFLLKTKDSTKNDDEYFARKEVVYFVSNPKSGSVYGLSPLESLYYAVLNDLNASKYNADFFKNNAEASGILGLEGMTFTDLLKFRNYWNRDIKNQPHKLAIVNGKPSWIPMNMTNRDMQFLEYQKWLLCKIMAVYGMQPVVLGVIDPTTGKLNSEQQLESFSEETVKPLIKLLCYQLTKVLVQQGFGFDDVKIDFESPDTRDEMSNTTIATTLTGAGIISVNEARKMYLGLNPIEGGDKLQSTQPTEGLPGMGLGLSQDELDTIKEVEVIEEPQYETVEKKVVRRGSKYCVVHAHPPRPGSKTDKPIGTVIRCFDNKKDAEKMHQAILISQAKQRGEL